MSGGRTSGYRNVMRWSTFHAARPNTALYPLSVRFLVEFELEQIKRPFPPTS